MKKKKNKTRQKIEFLVLLSEIGALVMVFVKESGGIRNQWKNRCLPDQSSFQI